MQNSDVCRERILSNEYYDFIVRDIKNSFLAPVSEENLCLQYAGFHYYCAYAPRMLFQTTPYANFIYNSLPKCFTPLSMDVLQQTGILSVQNYPTLQLRGRGVLIGFLDGGIDYQNPVFQNLDGTTRITAIWDQTIQSGTPPEDFIYGSEYTSEQINEALRLDNPLLLVPSTDETGHGTFTAGIAAGSGNPEQSFLGAAPEASIAMVKLKPAKSYLRSHYFIPNDAICYQENDIILGLRYLDMLATRLDLPLVICLPLGTNSGGHIGILPLSQLLNQYALLTNRVPVVGTGNESDKRHHFLSEELKNNNPQTMEIRVGENVSGFTLELWTTLPNILAVSILSPSGENTMRIPIRTTDTSEFEFLLERTKVAVSYRLTVASSTSELIFFRFTAPTPGIWQIKIDPIRVIGGTFHAWLPITELLDGEVFFLQSNPYYTVTNPGNAINAMVASYYDGNTNSIALASGRGYTRNEQIVPSFTAPGVQVIGPLPNNRFAARSGSSIATAVAAGASALMLDFLVNQYGATSIDSTQIESLFILGARRPSEMTFPNPEWGYGQLDVQNTLNEVRQF